jgi:hypothetical protein
MNDFNLSKAKFIKNVQIFSFIIIPLLVIILIYYILINKNESLNFSLFQIINEIILGIFTVLGTSIVAKSLIRSSMPIIQKVIIIMCGLFASIIAYYIFVYIYLYFVYNNIFDMNSIIKQIFELLFLMSFIIYYLNEFKLSSNNIIKYIQLFSFLSVIPVLILLSVDITELIFLSSDDKNINLQGQITIDKETGKAIGQGINQGMDTIGNVIGNKWGVAGAMGITGKLLKDTIIKSSLPPMQKAAIVMGGTILGGMAYSKITEMERHGNVHNPITSNTSTNLNNSINKFIDDNESSSPLQNLLFYIEITDIIIVYLIIILMIQILFKFSFHDKIKLNLSTIIGTKLNNNLEYYMNKIITLNKKMSFFWIWFILIILLMALLIDIYTIHSINIDLDSYINEYIDLRKK